jgi:hypothetical protein
MRLLTPPRTVASEQHQYVGAIVSGGQRAFNGIDLDADAFDASYKLLFFFVDMRHFP